MEKFTRMSLLLDIYGNLLTKRRRDVLNLYYNEDYSLGEIGEMLSITKQGARDAIVKGSEALADYENNLNILEKQLKQDKTLRKIIENTKDKEIGDKLKKLIYYEEE